MRDDVKRMHIDGKWVLAEGGATFDVINPADQSVVATVTNGAAPEIQRAVGAAHAGDRGVHGDQVRRRQPVLKPV